ncbi:MAG TPA: PAS domain-containing protein [Dongiaceae bacterium]|nr:PAS domain-containing protein [Dongiaceae bacterium]
MTSANAILDQSEDAVATVGKLVQSPRLQCLLNHWSAARGQRLMPGWPQIDATEIAPALSIIWSWKYDRATDRFTGRIAGDEIRSIIGRPIAGMPMSEYFAGWNYEQIFLRHRRVVAESAIAVERGLVFFRDDHCGLGERLILPLADDGIHGDGIIGATAYHLQPASFDGSSDLPQLYQKYRAMLGGTATRYFPLHFSPPQRAAFPQLAGGQVTWGQAAWGGAAQEPTAQEQVNTIAAQ